MTGPALAVAMCIAEVFGMLGFSTFPALIPAFEQEWDLTKTESGWISGIYFAGYVAIVPVLTSLTDRIDPRRVILVSLVVGTAGAVGFATLAEGFWTALVFRSLQGAGLAGTYMPGLKALSDATEGSAHQSRYVAFYTSSFGIGAGLSFVAAGEMTALLDWRWAFAVAAVGSAVSFVVIVAVLAPSRPAAPKHVSHFLDFRPVLRNRRAMRYILGYAGHNWELFAMRSWTVAFLVFAQGGPADDTKTRIATAIAAIATLLGVPASIVGNELAVRIGRHRWILLITSASMALSLVIGFSAGLSWGLAVALSLLYGILATGDSAALTAGTVGAAEPGQRGATLAMHSFIGFMGGIVGPPAVGAVLDAIGRDSVTGWGVAFFAVGFGSLLAFAAVFRR
jgi:MFS family permease